MLTARQRERLNEKKYFEASIALALLLVIALFRLFPSLEHKSPHTPLPPGETITLMDLPPATRHSKPPVPSTITILFDNQTPHSVAVDALKEIKDTLPTFVEAPSLEEPGGASGFNGSTGATEIVHQPRLLVEVFPRNIGGDVKGKIGLSLLIGKDGRVLEWKVQENTTNCASCEKQSIEAARKTQWLPAMKNAQPVEQWVSKSYTFN